MRGAIVWYPKIVTKLMPLLFVCSLAYAADPTASDLWSVVQSQYTPIVQKMETTWPITNLSELDHQSETFKLEAITTEGTPLAIGVIQMVMIKAPLATVAQKVDDVAGYSKMFEGLKKSEIQESIKDSDVLRQRAYFEQSVPVPFVPNDKNNMVYWVKATGETRKFYRYQFHSGNNLTSDDGLVVLDAISSRLTRYVEIDFFNANWGLAKTFGEKKIWVDSLRGILQTDYAFKLASENPTWTPDKVKKESSKLADQYPVEKRYEARTKLQTWLKDHGLTLEK
jgi:hypothetical protein